MLYRLKYSQHDPIEILIPESLALTLLVKNNIKNYYNMLLY